MYSFINEWNVNYRHKFVGLHISFILVDFSPGWINLPKRAVDLEERAVKLVRIIRRAINRESTVQVYKERNKTLDSDGLFFLAYTWSPRNEKIGLFRVETMFMSVQ